MAGGLTLDERLARIAAAREACDGLDSELWRAGSDRLAEDLWLHPSKHLLKIPSGVTWPVGIEQRLGQVMPRGYAELVTRGYTESEE